MIRIHLRSKLQIQEKNQSSPQRVDLATLEPSSISWFGEYQNFVTFKPEGTKEDVKSSQKFIVMIVQLLHVASRCNQDVIHLSKHNALREMIRIVSLVIRFCRISRKR